MAAETKGNGIQAILNAEPLPNSEGYLRIRLAKLEAEQKMLERLGEEVEGTYLKKVNEELEKVKKEQMDIKGQLPPVELHRHIDIISLEERSGDYDVIYEGGSKYEEELTRWKKSCSVGDILVIAHPGDGFFENRWEVHFLLPDKKEAATDYVTEHFENSYLFKLLGNPEDAHDRRHVLSSDPTFLPLVRKLMLTPVEKSWLYPKHPDYLKLPFPTIIQLVVELGIQHNRCVNGSGNLPIHSAAWQGDFLQVDTLLAYDETLMEIRPETEARFGNGQGYTPLENALYSTDDSSLDDRKKVVKELLAWGCNINFRQMRKDEELRLWRPSFEVMQEHAERLMKRRREQTPAEGKEIKRITDEVKRVTAEKDREIDQIKKDNKEQIATAIATEKDRLTKEKAEEISRITAADKAEIKKLEAKLEAAQKSASSGITPSAVPLITPASSPSTNVNLHLDPTASTPSPHPASLLAASITQGVLSPSPAGSNNSPNAPTPASTTTATARDLKASGNGVNVAANAAVKASAKVEALTYSKGDETRLDSSSRTATANTTINPTVGAGATVTINVAPTSPPATDPPGSRGCCSIL